MKKTLFFLILFVACGWFLQAQTNTFTAAIDNNWNNGLNWSLNILPTAAHDVVVPTGRTLNAYNVAQVRSIQVQAGATMTLAADLTFTQPSAIAATAIVNWNGGALSGGSILTNLGTINFGAGGKSLVGATTLTNSGTINIQSDWSLSINDGVLNNLPSGIIDFQVTANIVKNDGTGSHLLNNAGLIKKSTGTGDAGITADLVNTGTILIQSGYFTLQNPNIKLDGGVYNISAGAQLRWFSTVNCSGTLTGDLAGGLYWAGTVNVPTTAVFNFTGSGSMNWSNGILKGGGTLENRSTLFFPPAYPGTKTITELTTFLNTGTVNIQTDWSLDIANGTFNNAPSGIIDFQQTTQMTGTGTGLHALNNAGLIKKSTGIGIASIVTDMTNTGTLWVQAGYLDLNDPQIVLNNGIYNIDADCQLRFVSNVNCSGTLTGNVVGGLYWIGELSVATNAAFNFGGSRTIHWGNGILKGGGTLTNLGTLSLPPAYPGTKTITGGTTLTNAGLIDITTDWSLDISNGTLNNLASGIVDMKAPNHIMASNSGTHLINNAGLFKKSDSTGGGSFAGDFVNNGRFEVTSGTFTFSGSLNNTATGIIAGTTQIVLPAVGSFTNNGTISPGGSPGVLTAFGAYSSTNATQLAIEINGLTPGTQYDQLSVIGNAEMRGTVVVTLGYAPVIGDQFIVAATTGTITACDLAQTVSAIYNGMNYQFNVSCANDNKVILRLDAILANSDFATNEQPIMIAPNPATNEIVLKNISGKYLDEGLIIDLSGRVVKKFTLMNSEITTAIALDGLQSGQYYLKLLSGNGQLIKPFVIK